MQILPKGPRTIGESLGQGLGSGIENLAQMKLQHVLERLQAGKQAQGFQQAGLPPGLENLPTQVQVAYVKNYLKQPSEQAFGEATNILDQLGYGSQDQGQTQVQNRMNPMQRGQFENNLESLLGIRQPGDTLGQYIGQQPQQLQNRIGAVEQPLMKSTPTKVMPRKQTIGPAPIFPETYDLKYLSSEKKRQLSQTLRQMNPAQRKDFEKLRMEKVKESRLEQDKIDKELKPYINELENKGGQFADESDQTLQKMEKLVDSGKLTGPLMYNFRKRLESSAKVVGGGLGTAVGAGAGALLGSIFPGIGTLGGAATGATAGAGVGAAAGEALIPKFVGNKEDQEFMKLSTLFLRNLKSIFGARPAIQEMEAYMQGIPSLGQTDEGKKTVIHDLRLMSAGSRYMNKVKNDILRETKGRIPSNLKDMVNERSKPYLEKIKSQFLDTGLKNIQIDF